MLEQAKPTPDPDAPSGAFGVSIEEALADFEAGGPKIEPVRSVADRCRSAPVARPAARPVWWRIKGVIHLMAALLLRGPASPGRITPPRGLPRGLGPI